MTEQNRSPPSHRSRTTAGSRRRRGTRGALGRPARIRAGRCCALASTVALVLYFGWLLQPGRVGNPVLFGVLLAAELFNVVQALGFWWTCLAGRRRLAGRPQRCRPARLRPATVDVLIPTYSEPVEIVEADRGRGDEPCAAPHVRVALLDDGNREEMEAMAAPPRRALRAPDAPRGRQGRQHQPRPRAHRRAVTSLVLDCDHVPHADLLEATLPEFADRSVAFVQTPQYYANAGAGPIAARRVEPAGAVLRPDRPGQGPPTARCSAAARTSCSAARALESVGGFPEDSLTEDFELSVRLHEAGWTSAYVPEVLACRARPGGPRVLRQPAAPLGARLHRRDPAGAPLRPAAAAASCSTCSRRRTSCRVGRCWSTCRCR